MPSTSRRGFPGAGLVTGPAAWGISTQLNYVLVPVACGSRFPLIPAVALLLVLISLLGALLSWQAWSKRDVIFELSMVGGAPRALLAGLGAMAGFLFALIVLMQGVANLYLTGCEP